VVPYLRKWSKKIKANLEKELNEDKVFARRRTVRQVKAFSSTVEKYTLAIEYLANIAL